MGRPATVGDAVAVALRAVGAVQVAAVATVALMALVGGGVYGKSAKLDLFPGWLLAADAVLSALAVVYTVALYRRGDLDDHSYDLRAPDRRGRGGAAAPPEHSAKSAGRGGPPHPAP